MAAMTQVEQLPRRLLQAPEAAPRGWSDARPGSACWAGWVLSRPPSSAACCASGTSANPHQLVFDETYYVKQGWSMILFGVECDDSQQLGDKVDQAFTQGTAERLRPRRTGDLVVHPPVGKWLIGLGEWLFGIDSSFGWRFAVALLGTLSILMVGRAARRLLGSSLLGTIAALLLAVDGHHLVHSRTGLLDIIVMFFALARVLRPAHRPRPLTGDPRQRGWCAAEGGRPATVARWLGPWLGLRPWRWVAALCLGLCAGTKWSGVFFLVVFGLMTVFWDMGARRAAGIRSLVVRGRGHGRALPREPSRRPHRLVRLGPEPGGAGFASRTATTDSGRPPTRGRPLGVGAGLRALAVAVPRADLEFHRNLSPRIRTRPTPGRGSSRAGRPFFYEGPKKGQAGLHGRPVRQGDHLDRHPDGLVGRRDRLLRPALHVGAARDWRAGAILAGHRRRVPAVVQLPAPHHLSPSTRWRSCRSSCWPSPSSSGWCSAPPTPPAASPGGGARGRVPTSSSPWCCFAPSSTRSTPRRSSGALPVAAAHVVPQLGLAIAKLACRPRAILGPAAGIRGHDRGDQRHGIPWRDPRRPSSAGFWRRSSSWSLWPAAWPCQRPSLASRRRRQACSPHRSGSPWPPA